MWRALVAALVMRALPVLLALALFGCSERADDARKAELASVFSRADQPLIRARPALVAGKYARMAASTYSYQRGNLPMFLHDWQTGSELSGSRFSLVSPLVLGTGDPHPENYGVLIAGDGTLAVEPNDFDSADHVPYLWDLRRLVVGMLIGTRVSNPSDESARLVAVAAQEDIARATVEGYASTIQALANGAPATRLDDSQAGAIAADLLKRSAKDVASRDELPQLTELTGTKRRLLRGNLDPADPGDILGDLPAFVLDALPDTLAEYRKSLATPPDAAYFTVLDAVRRYGQGVASWPRVRLLLLVRGPTDAPEDDVILELRELTDSFVGGWTPPGVYYDTPAQRILATSRAAWARPDASPLWGVSTLSGMPCQIRLESEGQKTFRTRRFEDDLGTPQAIAELGGQLGALQARIHSGAAVDVANVIAADQQEFVNEQVRVSLAYADRVEHDAKLFGEVLADLGPRLGMPASESDQVPQDMAALIGTPPEISP
ncbi:MAG: DUF2252 family protein [Polyangiaceae bacterium]|nr:DUF2252 family protein [Polyangiaceae bacterium]